MSSANPIRPLSTTDYPAPAAEPVSPQDEQLALPRPRLVRTRTERLQETAGTVSHAVARAGSTVINTVRDLPRRFTVIRGRAQEKAGPIAHDLQRNARARALQMRDQARHAIQESPLEVLGGVFVAAFTIGVALRIWRTRD